MENQAYRPFEDCADPLVVVNGRGEIQWANPSAREFFSLMPAKNSSLAPHLSEPDLAVITNIQTFTSFEATVRLPSGNTILQQINATDISGLEPDSRAVLVAFKSAALQSSNLAAREEFLAQVAHDLKNPIGAIFGFADALLESRDPINATQRTVLARIRSTAMRCADMVRNYQVLADLPKIQSKGGPALIDIGSAVRAACEYAWRGERDEPTLVLTLADKPLLLAMDRGQLDRIIANLVSNAIRYSGSNGKVTIRTFQADASAVLQITNSGPPIPPGELSGIFSRHIRGSNSRGIPGSGLGLFIIKELTARSGGTVRVESDERVGTTFTVTLPLAAEPISA